MIIQWKFKYSKHAFKMNQMKLFVSIEKASDVWKILPVTTFGQTGLKTKDQPLKIHLLAQTLRSYT